MPEEVPAQHRPPPRAGKTYMRGAAAPMPPFMVGMGMGPRGPEYNRSPGLWLPASSAPLPMQASSRALCLVWPVVWLIVASYFIFPVILFSFAGLPYAQLPT